nr:hypothetical protein CFP56_22565 [Quercus suber]
MPKARRQSFLRDRWRLPRTADESGCDSTMLATLLFGNTLLIHDYMINMLPLNSKRHFQSPASGHVFTAGIAREIVCFLVSIASESDAIATHLTLFLVWQRARCASLLNQSDDTSTTDWQIASELIFKDCTESDTRFIMSILYVPSRHPRSWATQSCHRIVGLGNDSCHPHRADFGSCSDRTSMEIQHRSTSDRGLTPEK